MDGGACGYAGYGGQYVILSDMSISPASSTYLSIKHELGHCMGLQHSWIADDECDDTPPNPNCWDENQCQGIPSNNMMDYNNSESALTQCQINKMHNTLLRGGSVPVSKCVANILSFDSPYLQSNSEFLCLGNSPNTSKVVKLPFGVTVDWIPPSITDYYISIIKKGNTFSIVTQASIKENGQITARLNYGKLGYMDFKKNIFINGFQDIVNPSGYISTNVVGKIILTSSPITKIAFRDNIYFYYDESVTLNPGFEVENGGQLSIEKKYDECVEP
jgi:hypothetical protein